MKIKRSQANLALFPLPRASALLPCSHQVPGLGRVFSLLRVLLDRGLDYPWTSPGVLPALEQREWKSEESFFALALSLSALSLSGLSLSLSLSLSLCSLSLCSLSLFKVFCFLLSLSLQLPPPCAPSR